MDICSGIEDSVMAEQTVDWWKKVPCHFTWNLEVDVGVDFKSIVQKLDIYIEICTDTLWEESYCVMLLFRGYLEVSTFYGVTPNRKKAEKFFNDADNKIQIVRDSEERRAYTIVSLANRLWILEKFGDEGDDSETPNRETLIRKLENVWRSPHKVSDKVKAHLEATAAFALGRLVPSKYGEAESRYRKAIEIIPTQSSWWHTLGFLIGHQARLKATSKECCDEVDKEIKCYDEAIKLDPKNDSARCDLALALLKIPDREEDARNLIDNTEDNNSTIIIKKALFFRQQNKHIEALQVLQKGEVLKHPRPQLFYHISRIFGDLGIQAQTDRNFTKRSEYLSSEMKYLDKCLQLSPTHFYAKKNKAIAFGKLRDIRKGEEVFRELIEEQKELPLNLIEAKFSFAKYLHCYMNSNSMSAEATGMLEDVIDSSLRVLQDMDYNKNDKITGENGYLEKARKYLVEVYRTQEDGEHKIKELEDKLSNLKVQQRRPFMKDEK